MAADGTVMHGLALIYILRGEVGVEKFRIEQISIDEVRVQIVPGNDFKMDSLPRIEAGIKARLGKSVSVSILIEKAIPAEASGKFRYVISRVTADLASDAHA